MERMLMHYERLGATIVGVSATPYKGRGKPLRYWSRPCYAMSLREAIEGEWLAWPQVFLSEAKSYDLRAVEVVAGDWSSTQLEAVLTAEHAAQEVRSLVMSTYRRQPSVVYAHSVAHAKLLADVLSRTEPGTVVLHSHQSKSVRDDNLRAFVTGEARIVVNVGILGMGWDHPELRNIYLAAPSRALSRLEQRVGRGTRLLPGVLQPGMTREERRAARLASAKPTFNVYDITGTVGEHQFVSIFDVLDAKCRNTPARKQRLASTMQAGSDQPVDPMAEIAKADAEDLAAEEAKLAALRDRRRQLVVGVNFDHRSHDIFGAPKEAKQRGWRMLWGPYRGQLISTLPTSYLQHVRDKAKQASPFIQGVSKELSRRMESQREAS
jgi:superfamily II DNA/RNA helicase